MQLFFDDAQAAHRPTQYGVHGRLVPPLENPDRAATLIESLGRLGLTRTLPTDHGLGPIEAVHAAHYVDFLAEAYDLFVQLPNAGPEVLPNIHPYVSSGPDFAPRPPPRNTGILGRTGWYIGDLSCAMMEGTFRAAYASAQTAVSAADAVAEGAMASFALCRPPGHHAYADRANGFCFLNNSAIAAEHLRRRFGKVAIIDVDTHHGDGTQAIFYRRADGVGFNLNLPLPQGSGDEPFVTAVETLAEAAASFGAEALVLSAGWDAHRDDPLSKLTVTTDAYARIGAILGALRLPTVIVQEGGYSLAAVAEAAPRFVEAFRAAHGAP